jgi:amidohydrolase
MKETIQSLANDLHREVVMYRRHLHMHPELSFQEYETADFVSGSLKALGVSHKRVAKTGITGVIGGKKSGKKVVALRADLDALPIQEDSKKPYCSKNDGVMHACGHDVHTASLLGALHILMELRHSLQHQVRFIFQPGEEKVPGGAIEMIKGGVLREPKPTAIMAQHVHTSLRAGTVGFRSGMYMASADEIYITVIGKGGHAALPQDAVDPVVIASHLVVALQQLVSRNADPLVPTVLSFGKIEGGNAPNVIPDTVKLAGTLRTYDETWRKSAWKKIRHTATELCRSMGAKCEVEIRIGYPALKNEEQLTERARTLAQEYLGKSRVKELPMRMTAEDFSRYGQVVPGCFYRLGTGNPDSGITSPVHTSTFDIDEDALKVGVGLMAWLAVGL